MLYEFIHCTGRETKIFQWNQTINHDTCATTTPPHHMTKPFFFYIYTTINEKMTSQNELG